MTDGTKYDADYFLHGKATGKSLYEDYRWLPELTIPMAQAIAKHCGIAGQGAVLDFGCARGYLVKALRGLGYSAYGYDVSAWALENADPEAIGFLTSRHAVAFGPGSFYDWVVAKDVLEHVEDVEHVICQLQAKANKGIFAVVPLSRSNSGDYIVEDYEKDVTHIHRWTLARWVEAFLRPGWRVEAAYRVPGIKDNYAQYTCGNGFVTARRIEGG